MKRFTALDIFRGATIFLMIVVNSPGDASVTLPMLLHADWHGFTPTDLVFPSFLFAVGNALVFAQRKWLGRSFAAYFGKILRRTFLLFFLGYLMYWVPFYKWTEAGGLAPVPIAETRIWGVLQRIAVCYFAGALMVWFLPVRQLLVGSVVLLLGYWGLLWGFGDYSLEGNAVRSLDLFLFGEKHLYTGDGLPFDPEGLLSTLPAIVNVLAGYLAGVYIVEGKGGIDYEKLTKLMLAGTALLVGAYLWDFAFPINKKLWTSSFVLLTIGLDLIILAIILYATELARVRREYKFFQVFGMNPLFIYLLSEYLIIFMFFIRVQGEMSLYRATYLYLFAWMGPYIGSLAFALAITMICWGVGWWLWKRRVFIKV